MPSIDLSLFDAKDLTSQKIIWHYQQQSICIFNEMECFFCSQKKLYLYQYTEEAGDKYNHSTSCTKYLENTVELALQIKSVYHCEDSGINTALLLVQTEPSKIQRRGTDLAISLLKSFSKKSAPFHRQCTRKQSLRPVLDQFQLDG